MASLVVGGCGANLSTAPTCADLGEWLGVQNKCADDNQLSAIREEFCSGQQVATTGWQSAVASNASRALFTLAASGGGEQPLPLTRFVTNHLLEPIQAIEHKLDYYFSDFWLNSGDERTSKLPFVGAGPWKLIYATLVYLYLIKWLLPALMRPLKALELNWLIRVYNLLMVVCNLWAFYHGARILNFGINCFGCEIINHKDYSAKAIELLHYGWLFYMSRLVEWLDTIFFVLRKKERQVTKLHVFHHSFVPLISWTYLKYHPGYTVAFFPFVNTFVHSIMYTYYLLATFGPKIQPFLWWKRYLTSLQIAQFVLILIQLASIPLTNNDQCQYPRVFLYVALAGATLFLWLFYTYYVDTYSKQTARQLGASQQQNAKSKSKLLLHSATRAALDAQQATRRRLNLREGESCALAEAIEDAIAFPSDADESLVNVAAAAAAAAKHATCCGSVKKSI